MKSEHDYDYRNPSSIEAYAKRLIGKTFSQIISEDISGTGKSGNKGNLGQLIEVHHFHYKCNNDSRPDFPEAGVELKVTPYKENKDGSFSAKERLVLTKINYMEIVKESFDTGHFWNKSKLLLLIYYLYKEDVLQRFDYEIRYAHLFTPPGEDILIIRKDYELIVNKIKNGEAHKLSESDTLYLAACPKGAKSTDVTKQPFSSIPAKPRAFSFKASYMTYVLNNFVIPGKVSYEPALKPNELGSHSFEDALKIKLQPYIGLYTSQIEKMLGIEISSANKSYEAILGCRMLGVKSNRIEEFVKAGIITKIIKFRKAKSKNQHFRIEDFRFSALNNEPFDEELRDPETGDAIGWESSELYSLLKNRKYFFLVFWEDETGVFFKGCQLWGMPDWDFDIVKTAWTKTKQIIRDGVTFSLKTDKKGKISIENNLPGVKDNGIFHIRPHAKRSYYVLKDGKKYGLGSIPDTDILPNGERMPKQSYWLNRSYIEAQLDPSLVMGYADPGY